MSATEEEYPDDLNPFGDDEEGKTGRVEVTVKTDDCTNQVKVDIDVKPESEDQHPSSPPRSARGSILKAAITVTLAVPEEDDITVEITERRTPSPSPEVASDVQPEPGQSVPTEPLVEEIAPEPVAEKIAPEPVSEEVTPEPADKSACLNPFGEDDDEEKDEKPVEKNDVGQTTPSESSARSTPVKHTPFDPPPRPPPPKITIKLDYDDSLNPFADEDEETEQQVASKPPAVPRSPKRFKKKAPAPPPPSSASPLRPNSDDDRPRSSSRLSNASLDSAGTCSLGTPHRKKKPAPNAPIPPKRVFPDGFKEKLQRELVDVDVKMEQLRRQQETIKRQLAFFGIDDMDLSKNEEPKEDEVKEEVVEKSGNDSDYESRVDSALEAGGDTGSEVSAVSSAGKDEEDDAQTTERIVEKLTLLQEIGEEVEELTWRRKEVAFDLDDYALNEQHAELEHKIRVIQAKPTRLVTAEEKQEEARLIEELMGVVARRDALVEKMEQERNARRILVLEAAARHGNVGAVSTENVSEPTKKHKKYKLPKLKSKTLKKIKDKIHHHKEPEDTQKRSSKKS